VIIQVWRIGEELQRHRYAAIRQRGPGNCDGEESVRTIVRLYHRLCSVDLPLLFALSSLSHYWTFIVLGTLLQRDHSPVALTALSQRHNEKQAD